MKWTPEKIEEYFKRIIDFIEDGKSLRWALQNHDMPNFKTFYEWIENDSDKSKQYARACEERANFHFEEILDIADDSTRDTKILDDGREVVDHEVVQRSRLKIDARKWMLSKMNPKKYGDKMDLNVTEVPLSSEERAKRIAELQAKLNASS